MSDEIMASGDRNRRAAGSSIALQQTIEEIVRKINEGKDGITVDAVFYKPETRKADEKLILLIDDPCGKALEVDGIREWKMPDGLKKVIDGSVIDIELCRHTSELGCYSNIELLYEAQSERGKGKISLNTSY